MQELKITQKSKLSSCENYQKILGEIMEQRKEQAEQATEMKAKNDRRPLELYRKEDDAIRDIRFLVYTEECKLEKILKG